MDFISEREGGEVIVEDFEEIVELDVHDFVLGDDFDGFYDHLYLSFLHVMVIFQHQP